MSKQGEEVRDDSIINGFLIGSGIPLIIFGGSYLLNPGSGLFAGVIIHGMMFSIFLIVKLLMK